MKPQYVPNEDLARLVNILLDYPGQDPEQQEYNYRVHHNNNQDDVIGDIVRLDFVTQDGQAVTAIFYENWRVRLRRQIPFPELFPDVKLHNLKQYMDEVKKIEKEYQ